MSKLPPPPLISSWRTYPLNPRDLLRLTKVGGPIEVAFHAVQTGVGVFALYNIISTVHFQLTDGYFSPTAWFLFLVCIVSVVAAAGYGALAWWTRTTDVQEVIKASIRANHAIAMHAAQIQAQIQIQAAQGRASSSSLWSLAEKGSPTSSSALTPDPWRKVLRLAAFLLCPLPRVCILLGLVALTLLASVLQGYRIRKGTHCSLYEEPLRGFCRTTKSAVGAVFLESVLWLCWFGFWFFISFHKTPSLDEIEVDVRPSTSVNISASGDRRTDLDVEIEMAPTVPVQRNETASTFNPIIPFPISTTAKGHDSRQGDLDENQNQQSPHHSPPFEKGSQRLKHADSSSALLSSPSSNISLSGRTIQQQQQQQQQDRRTNLLSPTGASSISMDVSTLSIRAKKARPSTPARIQTTSVDHKVSTRFEGPKTRVSGSHAGLSSASSVSSFFVRTPDTERPSLTCSVYGDRKNNRNSALVPPLNRYSSRMSRSRSADMLLENSAGQRPYSVGSSISYKSSANTTRPRSISFGPSGGKQPLCLLRPPPCPLPSACNNNKHSAANPMDIGGKFGRSRPNSSEFVLLSPEDQRKVDLFWDGQLPYPPPPPLSPTSPSARASLADLKDAKKEKVLKGNAAVIPFEPSTSEASG